MGRPKTFDDDEVLDQVVACFRENGYGSTSIRDLEATTGLKATSLYRSFGNKASLFARALVRYRSEVISRRIAVYLAPHRGVEGIKDFFTSTYRSEPHPSHGCLVTNSAIEASHIDSIARSHIETGLSEIRNALSDQLISCQVSGEISPTVDVEATAQGLLLLYEGLLVLLRSGSNTVAFDKAIELTISSLLPQPTPTH